MKHYYNIIPSIRLPRNAPADFTYSHDQSIAPDTLVSIPFRHSRSKGLVYQEVKRPPFPTKSIRTVHNSFPSGFSHFLTSVASTTTDHPGTILKLSLLHSKPLAEVTTSDVKNNLQKTGQYIYPTFEKRLEWLLNQATLTQGRNERMLIVIPSQFEATRIGELLSQRLQQFIVLNPNALRSAANHRSSFCLVTTRIGCLLPIRFDHIICDDEPNSLYIHTEPSPAYDTRTILELRATHLRERITFSGYSLSCATQFTTRNKKIQTSTTDHNNRIVWIPTEHVERIPKTPITTKLIDELQSSRGHIGIIAPSLAFSRSVTCASCGFKPLCPSCDRAMTAINDYQLTCPRCQTRDTVPPFCPNCSGSSFKYSGFGATRLLPILSQSARIQSSNLHSISFWNLEQELETHAITTLCITDLDAIIPTSYDGLETVIHRLIKLLIQYQTINMLIQIRSDRIRQSMSNVETFFSNEHTLRKQLKLPPFGTLIHVRYYNSKTTKPLSFEQAQLKLCECLHLTNDHIQSLEQKKRKHPFYTFLVRLDHEQHRAVEWKKLPPEFHCLTYR